MFSTAGAPSVSAVAIGILVALIHEVPRVITIMMMVMMVSAPSPSFAVIVFWIIKPLQMALIGTKGPRYEEGRITAVRSMVGSSEVEKVVRKGVSAIGKAVHAVRQKRRWDKNQKAKGQKTTIANHFMVPLGARETRLDEFPAPQ